MQASKRVVSVQAAPCGCGCTTSATKQQLGSRKGWYDKMYARMISRQTARYNQLLDARKKQLLSHVVDDAAVKDVLEVGIGSGANLPYYASRKDIQLAAVDPNPEMLHYLKATCEEVGFPVEQVSWQQGVAEELPLQDSSQDVVISTLVLCSVADQRAAVSEIHRVLRPGGSFLFMEHVAHPLGTWSRSVQELVNPAWKYIADGCHVNRETWSVIKSAGFSSCDITHFEALRNPLFTLLSPHIVGRAVK